MEILKVSSHSSPNSVAGAIAGVIREQRAVEVQAVGAGAANQAIKSIAIARGYLAPIGVDLICIPAFANIQIDGEERTAIKLICEQRLFVNMNCKGRRVFPFRLFIFIAKQKDVFKIFLFINLQK